MDIDESTYEGVTESSYKNPLGKTPTMMITVSKREYNPPHHRITTRQVRALESAENDM